MASVRVNGSEVEMNDFTIFTSPKDGRLLGGVHLPTDRRFGPKEIRDTAKDRAEMLKHIASRV